MATLVELAVRRIVKPKDTPLMNTSTLPSPRRNTITLVTPASASNVNGARKKRLLAALAEGQDWDTLAEAHNDDPGMKAGAVNAAIGYPVCEGFTQFDAAFVEGAMALQNVGDYSDKIEGSYGYYIIQYTSDVVEGAVDMETVHDTISSSLLSSKQSTVRDEVVAQWVKDANATINKDILND